jgi:hypothetical protein
MAYTNAWKRNQRYVSPAVNPNLGAGANRVHLDPIDHGHLAFGEPTPALPETPGYLYATEDFMLPVGTLVHYPVDHTPEGHDVGGVDRGRTLIEGQQLAGAAHSVDHGAGAVHHFDPPVQRAVRDSYRTERVQAEFAVSTSRMALVRGRNALPENNPDGPPPQGHYVTRWIDRQHTRRPTRHDMVPLRLYRAATAADAPAPAPAQASPYTSPFRRLAPARLRKLTTPQIRRVPRPPDEFAEVDGTQDPQFAVPVYWQDW